MTQFKVGDRVRVATKRFDMSRWKQSGLTGMVDQVSGGGGRLPVYVTFDSNTKGEPSRLCYEHNDLELIVEDKPVDGDFVVALLDEGEVRMIETPRVYPTFDAAITDAQAAARLLGGEWGVFELVARAAVAEIDETFPDDSGDVTDFDPQ